MATQSVVQPLYRGNFYGLKTPTYGGPERPLYKETASQSYEAGDLVYLDSNGTIAICTTSSDRMDGEIAGQATKAATGTTGAAVHFRPIIPGDTYDINLYHTTAGSAVGTQATIGTVKGLWWKAGALGTGSTSKWVVDLINTAEDGDDASGRVRIINCPDRLPDGTLNAITDTYARVTCMFLTHTLSTDGDPNKPHILQFGC